MGDMGDFFRDLRESHKERRRLHGVECPECKRLRPRAHPTILLPQQRCRVDGYRDLRPELADGQ